MQTANHQLLFQQFKYLGCVVSESRNNDADIENKVKQNKEITGAIRVIIKERV